MQPPPLHGGQSGRSRFKIKLLDDEIEGRGEHVYNNTIFMWSKARCGYLTVTDLSGYDGGTVLLY